MNKKILLIIFGVVVIGILCMCTLAAGVYVYVNRREASGDEDSEDSVSIVSPQADTTDEDLDTTTDSQASTDETGDSANTAEPVEELATITGSLSFPSEFLPEHMTVCADNVSTAEEICTDEHLEDDSFLYGFGYLLNVPAGSYYVYAYDPDGDNSYKAYYSEFVTCGLSVDCTSHEAILVTVLSGETAENVDPGDWYNF